MHLRPEEFVDLAEGTRSAESLPHLDTCERCRHELAAVRDSVRAALSSAADGGVPDPSPAFWDRFSTRVNDAIEADAASRLGWLAWTAPRFLVPLSALAVLVLVVALMPASRARPGQPGAQPAQAVAPAGAAEARDGIDPASDPLLAMVADLSANMDLDSAADAGLADRDTADRAVSRMTDEELQTMKRLLQAAMSQQGD